MERVITEVRIEKINKKWNFCEENNEEISGWNVQINKPKEHMET